MELQTVVANRPSVEEIERLVGALEAAEQLPARGRAVKRVCQIFDSKHCVVSWKFNEWDYGKNNIRLPSNARGLFILDDPEKPCIVARGYDKFFNVDETVDTKWDSLSNSTVGPYEVTAKANGCIIFISGLQDGTLVVCSKHSTGYRDDVDRNHALAGETMLKKQLQAKNIDIDEFAKLLYNLNVTAVAEYCDDAFEEHILEYATTDSGLYLHGINLNQPDFETWPMEKVNGFSHKYGFKAIKSLNIPKITSLKEFLEKCAESGSYDNKEIEGFVIRCRTKNGGKPFFFKYKFEEPYLMYRQWREATKAYISTKSRVFKFQKHKFITNKYMDFVIPILDADHELCANYMKGFGIIKLRNMFLKSYGMSGIEILNHEKVQELELKNAVDYNKIDSSTKFLIIPVAVIGCGKTTIALTLKNLYPSSWGHVQNDNITGKDKSKLMKCALELLAQPEIKCVIVDRNNHQMRERQQLFEWFRELKEEYLPYDANVKIIGLSFAGYEDLDRIREITIQRVLARGDNHQSIKLGVYGEKKVLGIMSGFINRYQPIDESKIPDSMFDLVIPLKVKDSNSSLENTKIILEQLNKSYSVLVPHVPCITDIQTAFEQSLEYKPVITKIVKNSNKNNHKNKFTHPIYFSAEIANPDFIISELQNILQSKNVDGAAKVLIRKLINENKLQPKFHITLAHVAAGKRGTPAQKQIWQQYINHYKPLLKAQHAVGTSKISTSDYVEFSIQSIVWDEKIVAASVALANNSVINKDNKPVPELQCTNTVPHITLAVLQEGVFPAYSNEVCQRVNSIGVEPVYSWRIDTKHRHTADVVINI